METQAVSKLKELNFNEIFKLDADIKEYSYEQFIKNGRRHPLAGMCTRCEEAGVNACPADKNFTLKAMGHGAASDDILAATGQQGIDTSSWKEPGVMFVMENPGRCAASIYTKVQDKGYSKYPSHAWFFAQNSYKYEYPAMFQGRKYDEFTTSAMFTFKLKSLYITDIVKCGMNDRPDGGNKNINEYDQRCVKNCVGHIFNEEIKIVNPKIIFCLSRKAEIIINEYKNKFEQLLKHPVFVRYIPHPNARLSNAEFQDRYYNGIVSGLFDAGIISGEEKEDYLKKAVVCEDKISHPEKRETKEMEKKAETKTVSVTASKERMNEMDPREELREVQDFLESNGIATHPHPLRRNDFGGNANNGIAFCLFNSARNGFKFLWTGGIHKTDQKWYEERNTTISKLFPGSIVKGPRQGWAECRLFIPVDREHYCEHILHIIQKTRSIMGY